MKFVFTFSYTDIIGISKTIDYTGGQDGIEMIQDIGEQVGDGIGCCGSDTKDGCGTCFGPSDEGRMDFGEGEGDLCDCFIDADQVTITKLRDCALVCGGTTEYDICVSDTNPKGVCGGPGLTGCDLKCDSTETKDICNAVWTDAVKAAWTDFQESQTP